MIYIDTHRDLWRAAQTFPRFFGTGIVLGFATLVAASPTIPHIFALLAAILFKLAVEARVLLPLDEDGDTPTAARKTAEMLTGPLRVVHSMRIVSALLAAPLALFIHYNQISKIFSWGILVLLLASELAERYLYFRAVVAPKMPGVISK